jgi:hypothetical protein
MNPVIINLATGRYLKGQERLKQSVQRYSPKIPVMSWQNEFQISGCPKHSVNPYAFKPYAFIEALKKDYDVVFWMDASCYLIKDIQPILDIVERDGYFMHEAGHWTGSWANDNSLAYFRLTREEAMTMPMFTAGCFGLNLKSEIGATFLSQWLDAANAGAFKGSHADHRHDMACGSIIANRLGMKFQFGEHYLEYKAPETPEKNETVIIGLQGLA